MLSNIPHGFFEGQMESFFRQFGVLKNLRLVRSRRVSRGALWILFVLFSISRLFYLYIFFVFVAWCNVALK